MIYQFDKGGIARLAHRLLADQRPRDKATALTHLQTTLGVYDSGGTTLANVVDGYFSETC